MTELIFVIPGIEVNGQYYRDVLLSQQMLPAIKHVASDTFSTRQRSISSCKDTIKQLQQETPDFIGPNLWPCTKQPCRAESSGLQFLRCCAAQSAWMSHEQCRWAEAAPHWHLSLQQNVIDAAINECRKQLKACMHEDGQHFEHLLRARVTSKNYGQIKYK